MGDHIKTTTDNIYDFDIEIKRLLDIYSNTNIPIEVSFKELVPKLNKADRATHLIHTYPAKLLMHIPHFFLNNNIFSKVGDTVLDPFCGSGTVILESILAKRRGLGADANPLARLISQVKTYNYDVGLLKIYASKIFENVDESADAIIPYVGNINYWFLPKVQKCLSLILQSIDNIENQPYKNFFLVCFSNCIKKVSLADSRVTVPVRLRIDQYPENHPLFNATKRKIENIDNIDVYAKFKECVDQNINRVHNFNLANSNGINGNVISDDARNLAYLKNDDCLTPNSISLVITSPPYAGAQKYIRASSLNLGWLKLISDSKTLKSLENLNIGREHYLKEQYKHFTPTNIQEADVLLKDIFEINPLRAFIAGNYLMEMKEAFEEIVKYLKPGGYFVLVAANNVVCKKEFKTQEYLLKIMQDLGMKVVLRLIDDIKSYGLMTKRNKTANVITREWVLVFQK